MVDDGKQPLSDGNQGLPVHLDVKQSLPVENSGKDKITNGSVKLTRSGRVAGMGLNLRHRSFDWQRKRRFLRFAKRFWPNVNLCCAAAGISDSTFYSHRKNDPIFALKVAEVDRSITDRIEGVMADEAVKPASFLDRMAYLRAHRPELYNPARKIIVEGYKMSEQDAIKRSSILGDAIDATIVNAYTNRKERSQAKREGSSLLPSGDSEGVRGEDEGDAKP